MFHHGGLWAWLAWMLPRPLVYWATIRLAGYATSGVYGATDPSRLSVMDALARWAPIAAEAAQGEKTC